MKIIANGLELVINKENNTFSLNGVVYNGINNLNKFINNYGLHQVSIDYINKFIEGI